MIQVIIAFIVGAVVAYVFRSWIASKAAAAAAKVANVEGDVKKAANQVATEVKSKL